MKEENTIFNSYYSQTHIITHRERETEWYSLNAKIKTPTEILENCFI